MNLLSKRQKEECLKRYEARRQNAEEKARQEIATDALLLLQEASKPVDKTNDIITMDAATNYEPVEFHDVSVLTPLLVTVHQQMMLCKKLHLSLL